MFKYLRIAWLMYSFLISCNAAKSKIVRANTNMLNNIVTMITDFKFFMIVIFLTVLKYALNENVLIVPEFYYGTVYVGGLNPPFIQSGV